MPILADRCWRGRPSTSCRVRFACASAGGIQLDGTQQNVVRIACQVPSRAAMTRETATTAPVDIRTAAAQGGGESLAAEPEPLSASNRPLPCIAVQTD
ncbi:hypothetical protein XA68_18085 [Ophiocordyceps unilateralis]|uniref:Uncharacterized protein n=1 Tax=Ophiocordyceps unilateralis TaxID=268505 RepID=A0A2A9P3U6_OPHUN|nr:hypothetical protein XA68_18085 [Ophiocordyceps unilateralis]